jgi:CRP-like cAMP-binding protein
MTHDVVRIETAFGSAALFARLTPNERRRLARRATLRVYPAGSAIIQQGDTSMSLYVVMSGRVRVEVQRGHVRDIGPGDFFGEMGVIDDRPRSASVVAVEPTECALVSALDVRENGAVAVGLLPTLVERLREVSGSPIPADDREWLVALEGGG